MLKNVDKFQDFNLHTISLSKVFLFEDNAYFEFSQVLYIWTVEKFNINSIYNLYLGKNMVKY